MIDELYFLHKNIRRTVITTYRRPHDKWAYLKIRPFSILRLSKLGYDIYSTRKIRVMANWSLKFTYNYITQTIFNAHISKLCFWDTPTCHGTHDIFTTFNQRRVEGWDGVSNFHVLCNVHCTWKWCTLYMGMMYTPVPNLMINYKFDYYDFSKRKKSFIIPKDAT